MKVKKESIQAVSHRVGASPAEAETQGSRFGDEPLHPSAYLCFTCGGRDFFPMPIGDPVCLTCHPMRFPEVLS